MNLFCFTMEGSSDSLYEPVQTSPGTTIPSRLCSPRPLKESSKWGGSQPCVAMECSRTPSLKKTKRTSHVPMSASDEALDNAGRSNARWQTSRKRADLEHVKNDHNGDMGKDVMHAHVRKAENRAHQLNPEKREKESRPQGVNFEAWNPYLDKADNRPQDLGEAEGETEGTLKKIQRRARAKKGSQSSSEESKTPVDHNSAHHLADPASKDDSPVITCIGLAKRADRKPSKATSPQQEEQEAQPEQQKSPRCGVRDLTFGDAECLLDPGPLHQRWGSTDSCPAWDASYHTCQRPAVEQRMYSLNFTLPRGTDWNKYESLIQQLEPPRELSLQRVVRSVTDLDAPDPMRTTSFGKFDTSRHHASQAKAENSGAKLPVEGERSEGDQKAVGLGKKMRAISMTMRKRMGRKYVKALSEETGEDGDKDHEAEAEAAAAAVCSSALAKGFRRSSNSLESLYSLNSGQSSSSGVTSGSDGSCHRESLRLAEDHCPGQFCGRAKVHTDFVPSPYDTESLRLKVGDVIDIISKPPMGIWTGMLHNKVGSFKFIYVDEIPEKEAEPVQKLRPHRRSKRPRPKTLQELLERLNLEEYASSLLLNGYQTVEDLKELREQHLMELNVIDPEHRQRLLAATECLQDSESVDPKEGETDEGPRSPSEGLKVEVGDCPRDSGCYIASDCSDNSKENAENPRAPLSQPSTEV